MKKLIIAVLCSLVLTSVIMAQEQPVDSLIIQGKKMLNATLTNWNEQELMQARAYFERLLPGENYAWLIHYYVGFADYRLISYYFSKNQQDRAERFIEDGIDHLKKSVELKEDFAEAHSLLSSIYGNKIAVSPMKAITLGPKSGSAMSKAVKIDPDNPRTHLIAGQSAYFTPKLFGGGKDKAKAELEKSIQLFKTFKVASPLYPEWGHEEAYSWLGLVYADQENFETAVINYQHALEINPDYGWVKFVLLPQAEKQLGPEK